MNTPEVQMRLRPLAMTDLPVVMAWSRDKDFCRANEWRTDLTAEQADRWLRQTVNCEISDLVRLGVDCGGELVGYVDLAHVTEESAEFGIAIGDSSRWGQGLGTAAGRAILEHGFDHLGLQHVDAVVSPTNTRSQRLVTGLGFRRSFGDPPPGGVAALDEAVHFRLLDDEWRMLTARIMPMTVLDAERVAAWRYRGPWSIYDLESSQPLIEDIANYFVITAGDRLVGFCCTGAAARVRGVDADPAVLDVGLGMDPALLGRGLGMAFGRTVLRHVVHANPGDNTLRVFIQSWNERSLRLAGGLGLNRPEFHAPSGFCEPADRPVTSWE